LAVEESVELFGFDAVGAFDFAVEAWCGRGLLFLVALPAPLERFVALRAGQAVHLESSEDPPHPGLGNLDVVVALDVHRDLQRPEVVVLAQVMTLPITSSDVAFGLWCGRFERSRSPARPSSS
jgi:hypothetical protein